MPLKIKHIITTKRTAIFVFMVYVVVCLNTTPVYYSHQYGPIFFIRKNKTLFGASRIENGDYIESTSMPLSCILRYGSHLVVIVCTVILAGNLYLISKWRISVTRVTTRSLSVAMTTKDKNVVKIVALVSATFVLCTLPSSVNVTLMLISGFDVTGRNSLSNTFLINWGTCMVLEEVNSSISIFIYYNISSQFRSTLRGLLSKKKT